MDLSEFDGMTKSFEEGIEVTIRHPITGKPTDVKIRVRAYASERVKAVQRRFLNKQLRDQQKKKSRTIEEVEEISKAMVMAAVISWEGLKENGKPIECTPENIRKVLDNPDLSFIAEQIDEACSDQAAFMKASPTS